MSCTRLAPEDPAKEFARLRRAQINISHYNDRGEEIDRDLREKSGLT